MTAPDVAVRRLRNQLPLLVSLVLVWNLLWGTWSWANLISGALVAVAVTCEATVPIIVKAIRQPRMTFAVLPKRCSSRLSPS